MDGQLTILQAFRGELEIQLEAKLDNPFIPVAGDLAVRATRIRNTYCVEVGVIESIEGFSAELQVDCLVNLKGAQERKVPALITGAPNRASGFISNLSIGNIVAEGSLVEPLGPSMWRT
jgi:hypothetical protein